MSLEPTINHHYAFDPTHGYDYAALLAVSPPAEPEDFVAFWQARRERAMRITPDIHLQDCGWDTEKWRVFEMAYRSSDAALINGWLLIPRRGTIKRGLVVTHGYLGREQPDFDLPFEDAALLFPVMRGMKHSPFPPASTEPRWHVLHNIQDRDLYILGGCVDDIWLAVTSLLRLYPQLDGHIGYLGISFGGGLGALALPWEARIQRAHFNVPTFGQQRLRLELGSVGSAHSVQQFMQQHPQFINNLDYFDAALAAKHLTIPVHCALAEFDPMVAPAGQYAIYNALAGRRHLFRLSAGHHAYPRQALEKAALKTELADFFATL